MGGHITHAGFVSKITNIPLEDALSIQILKTAGAVIHVRTNQPQSLMVGILHVVFPVRIDSRDSEEANFLCSTAPRLQ